MFVENFRKICLEFYELDLAKLLSVSGLAWQATINKAKVDLELLTDIDMFLMVEKGIRGAIFQAIHKYTKANNKYIEIMIKIRNLYI